MINLGTYFKFLSRNKFYTFVTVFGFAMSLMFVFLIAMYTTQELSVDRFQEKGDRIYVLANEHNTSAAFRLGYALKDRYPEIEEVVHLTNHVGNQPVTVNETRMNVTSLMTEPSFFTTFSFPFIEGDPNTAFREKNSAVITESFAHKVFPKKDPIGETIWYNDSVQVRITGIMKDIQNSTIPNADILISFENVRFFNSSIDMPEYNNAGGVTLFLLEKQGANLETKREDMLSFLKEIFWPYQRGREEVKFIPLRDIYFYPVQADMLHKGERSFVVILILVGGIILLFSVFNYINLTVAQSSFRAREMSTRNLLGAAPNESFIRLILESIVLITLSLLLAVLFAYILTPYAEDLLKSYLYIKDFLSLPNLLIAVLLIVVLGVISGIIPAYMISRYKSIDVVRGSFKMKNRMVFSKVFIVIQNVITIVLITSSIVIARQVNHLIQAPLGYNTKNIIHLQNDIGYYEQIDPLVSEWEQLASVKRIGYSQGIPLNHGNNNSFEHNGKPYSLQILNGDPNFFDMLGFEVMQHNHKGHNHLNYYTEYTYKEFGMTEEDTHVPGLGWHTDGQIKDFKLGNILSGNSMVLVSRRDHHSHFFPWNLLVEVEGDPDVAFNQVKAIYERMTGLDFNGRYMDDMVAATFAPQQRLLKILTIFCGIAILISALGLIAISTYFIRQRKREIALRKVLGSTNGELIFNLVKSFLTYVGIAFLIAVPIAFFFLRNWLDDFAYRISLNPLYFLLAGLLCFLVSLLAVFFQSFRAANANPVNALKSE